MSKFREILFNGSIVISLKVTLPLTHAAYDIKYILKEFYYEPTLFTGFYSPHLIAFLQTKKWQLALILSGKVEKKPSLKASQLHTKETVLK